MNQQLVPLASTDPAASPDDLVALDPFLRGHRIVAMGEATHGTKEFFDVKHRLFRYLVRHHGYTVMAMELPFDTSVRIDDYVKGAGTEADLQELVQGSYWFVDSKEYIELFRWMRQHNVEVDADERLEVFGFDIQRPRGSAAALAAMLASEHPVLAKRYGELLAPLAGDRLQDYGDLEGLDAALEQLQREAGLGDRAGHHIAVLRAHLDMVIHCDDRFGCKAVKRDMYMAQNVRRRLEGSSTKALVWAHNGHVGRAAHPDGWWPMGHHLAQWLGDELYVIGLEFDHGGFVAPAGGAVRVARTTALAHLDDYEVAEYVIDDPAPPGTIPHLLAQAKMPLYFLPLSAVAADPELERYFERTRSRHEYGGLQPKAQRTYADQTALNASYDAVLFVEQTHGYTFTR